MTPKRTSLSWYLDRFSPPEGFLLLVLSVIVGASTGLASVVFVKLIYFIQNFSYGSVSAAMPFLGKWIYFLIPAIGGLLVGPMILYASEAKGHGVPEVMQALILGGGRIRPRVAATKIVASSICIGTGGSAGREGPIIQVGSALGSFIGQTLHLSDERVRNLVACGAAAGIAATFNAPIAGVAFAIEVLMCGLQMRAFSNVVIAAVSASVVSRAIIGNTFLLQVPTYGLQNHWEIFLYLILGLIAALVGVLFIRMLYYTEAIFDGWDFPQLFKPAIGGLFIGCIGVVYMTLPHLTFPQDIAAHGAGLATPIPHMYGSGFPFIQEAIQGKSVLWILLILILLKPVVTSLTLGSGNSGGVFAPSLFTGAVLGGAMGQIFDFLFPTLEINTGAFALVGMTALFSATARAPFTSMLIVFEMSNDYFMILPLMAAGVTSSYFAQWLHPESIYTFKLAKRGVRFAEGRDMDIMQGVKISEVMKTHPVTIDKDASFAEAMALIQEKNILGFPVICEKNRLWGILTLQDMHRAQSQKNFSSRGLKVKDLAVENPITVFPDEPIWAAIQKMSPRDLARLPVVLRDGSKTLCGIISRSDILRAYDVGVVRKQRGLIVEEQIELRKSKENGFVEFVLKEEDTCSNAMVKDLPLPDTINLVSIKRAGEILIPKGDTRLNTGDVITVFGRLRDIDGIKDFLNNCKLPEQLN